MGEERGEAEQQDHGADLLLLSVLGAAVLAGDGAGDRGAPQVVPLHHVRQHCSRHPLPPRHAFHCKQENKRGGTDHEMQSMNSDNIILL